MSSLSPLAGIQSFQSGIGDGDDLKAFVREDPDGGWRLVLKSGFYYVGASEGYLYAQKRYQAVSVASSGAIATATVTGLEEDPTEKGPIYLREQSTGRLLQRVCSPLQAFQELSFAGSGDVQTADASGFVISVVSDPVTGVYLRVPDEADIISSEDYVYDPVSGTVTIKDATPPSVFASWLVPETASEQLQQQEIVRVDKDGNVRVQFTGVCNLSGLQPLVRKPTASGAVIVTGSVLSGNVIELPSGAAISSGDLVAVDYYVQGSYSAVYDADTQTLTVRYLAKASGTHLIEWEGAENDHYDTFLLPEGHANRLQLNPLLERHEPCFVYLCDSSLPLPTPSRITMIAADQNPLWSAHTPQPVLLQVRVTDSEGLHVPQAWVDLTATLGGESLTALAEETDWHGKALFQLTPNASGDLTLTATVRGTSVTGALTLPVHDKAATETPTELQQGKLLMHLEHEPFRDNLVRLNAYYCYPDGAPYQPNSTEVLTAPWHGAVVFSAGKSTLYTLDGRKLGPSGSVELDADSVASVLVDPVAGDLLRAQLTTNDSRLRRARPIRILDQLSDTGDSETLPDTE